MKISFPKPPTQASDGIHIMTIADLVSLGPMTSTYGDKTVTKDKLKLKGFVDELDFKSGKPIAIDKLFTSSMHKKSAFFKFVKTVTGTAPKPNGSDEFDCDSLVGRTCRITTERVTNERGCWAHITDFEPVQPGDRAVLIPLDFKRGEDNQPSNAGTGFTVEPEDAEDTPTAAELFNQS